LIHRLNQRYHAEWVRAELLRNELDGLRQSRLGRLVAWYHRLKGRLGARNRDSLLSLTERAAPYLPAAKLPAPSGRVSIIIPFKDRPELLANCLRSLRSGTFRNFEVILVDNGSTNPRTLALLERLKPRRRYRLVAWPEPFNFSRLCNAGAAQGRGEYLLFLNNDTEVLTRDWLEQLLRIGVDPRVGVVGATLLYPDRTLQHAGLFPRADGLWVHPYRGLPADHPGEGNELLIPRIVPAVTAACLLVRRSLFQELGGFDARFAETGNDVDLCLRARQRGLAVIISPDAQLFHYEGLSRGFTLSSL
jgi:GT2 family glycosyltransferase